MAKDTEQSESDKKIDKLVAVIESLVIAQMSAAGDGGGGANAQMIERLSAILETVSGNQVKAAEVIERAQRASARPSNEVAHMRSELNPRGELLPDWVKPRLLCDMMIPWRAENESSTREEVELLNLMTKCPGQYVVERNDESRVKLSVKLEWNEDETRVTRMVFSHDTAFRNEYFRTMPPLARMLRQMLSQNKSEEVQKELRSILTMKDEKALIEAGQLTVSV